MIPMLRTKQDKKMVFKLIALMKIMLNHFCGKKHPQSQGFKGRGLILGLGFLISLIVGPSHSQVTEVSVTVSDSASQNPRPYLQTQGLDQDRQNLKSALSAARAKRTSEALSYQSLLSDPVAKKLVTWALINHDAPDLGFLTYDGARRDLWGWPRESKRQVEAEKRIGTSVMTPQQILVWFKGAPPQSIDGAVTLISAYESLGQNKEAETLLKQWWRTKLFDMSTQSALQDVYGSILTVEDHDARLKLLLLNPQSQSAGINQILPLAHAQGAKAAAAVLAMRSLSSTSDDLYEKALSDSPIFRSVLAFERARYLQRRKLEPLGFSLLRDLPSNSLSPEAAQTHYNLRLGYFRAALTAKDYQSAYYAMQGAGFPNGEYRAESEFFAGWMALVKLNDPALAYKHFQSVGEAGTSPITQGRAQYWMGRALEAMNRTDQAKLAYTKGGENIYTFYGQLAAEKAGQKTLKIGPEPIASDADRQRFENRELVKAARLLGDAGELDIFYQFALTLAQSVPNAEEATLVVDMAKLYDRPINVMRLIRQAMQRGLYMPERAYPIMVIPDVGGPEKSFSLAIIRQESGFDPVVRSHANARGMMQLIPSTARAVARRLGMNYKEANLYEPQFNMSLGAYHLQELTSTFNGSYVLASVGYNAGPTRIPIWVERCGDPRGDSADALSFIECMPLTETRNYIMRVTENIRVYRARLNGGEAPLTAMADITRGQPVSFGSIIDETGSGANSEGPVSYSDYLKSESSAQSNPLPAAAALPAAMVKPINKKATIVKKSKSKSAKPKSKKSSKTNTSKTKAKK
jgi:soluble lytic murein transglycosylase